MIYDQHLLSPSPSFSFSLKVGDPIFDHCFMLGSRTLDKMNSSASLSGSLLPHASPPSLPGQRRIAPWHIEQYQDEAVMIPAGCPHQVGDD